MLRAGRTTNAMGTKARNETTNQGDKEQRKPHASGVVVIAVDAKNRQSDVEVGVFVVDAGSAHSL